MFKIIKNNRGSELIEAMGDILCICIFLAFGLSFLPCFVEGQKLQHFATSMVRNAEVSGSTNIPLMIDQLKQDTKINPTSISWSGTKYIGNTSKVQLNDKIVLTLTSSYKLELFGFYSKQITLTARASGSSEVYHK